MAQTKVRFDRAVEGATNIVDSGTEGTKVASGTTGQRGSTTGQFRFNTTTGKFEGRNAAGSFVTIEATPTVSNVDVTDTANVKVKFDVSSLSSGSSVAGGSDQNQTHFTFIRLGDT